jgi:hypothetical protein
MARYDDLNTSIIAYSTVLSSLLLVAIILGVYALAATMASTSRERREEQYEYVTSETTQREQLASINGSIEWIFDSVEEEPENQENATPAVSADGTTDAIPETTDGMVDEPTERLQIPIKRAMQLTLERLKQAKVATPEA